MPLTLAEYADHLDERQDLNWPAPPAIESPKAKPFLKSLPEVQAVVWRMYGTLLAIPGGELWYEHPQEFVMDIALDKVIQEFRMWQAMTRKPGKPSEQMLVIYRQILSDLRMQPSPQERYPEIRVEKIWQSIVKKLSMNDYTFNAGFYGGLDEYSQKIAYFFQASIQGSRCYDYTIDVLEQIQQLGKVQGVIDDGQSYSSIQLERGLHQQKQGTKLAGLIPEPMQVYSFQVGGRKPSDRLYQEMVNRLQGHGISPAVVLYIGTSIEKDIIPAKKLGWKTGLFAGDKASLQVKPEQLKSNDTRPDILLTELSQITDVLS